ncbi:reverse transcriptase family protein [Pseudodesulfovibrio alkaliphilus]|uniref:reverse transcriptase family protein n=1 Tax=Pseudodesulfovibrio alkaliphilus TaxID=2661613 RepID=UPI0018C8B02E
MTPPDPLCPIVGIKSPKSLARILGYPLSQLEELCGNIESNYHKKEITKKNGAVRVLSVPSGALRKVQTAILRQLQKHPLHPAAYGAVQRRCHIDNAKRHAAAPYVYCLDFSSFFPSISSNRIYKLLAEQLGCSPPVSNILTKLTTYKYKLPTGSPTSPVLTNILCFPLDNRLNSLACDYGLTYTRFIDDLTFSGRRIPEGFIRKTKEIITSFGLLLNDEKEELFTPYKGKLVTGINVNTNKVRVSRYYKKSVRAQKHQFGLFKDYMTDSEKSKEESRIDGKEQYIRLVQRR